MMISDFIRILQKKNLTDGELKTVADELAKNTFLRYLSHFNMLSPSFVSQWQNYLDRHRVINHAGQAIARYENDVQDEGVDETSVHDQIFQDKRNSTMKSLEAMQLENRGVDLVLSDVKVLAEEQGRYDIARYIDFVQRELSGGGGSIEEEINLALTYYMSQKNDELKLDVLSPLDDAMNAYTNGIGYYNERGCQTYSCMPGLSERLLDRVSALIASTQNVDVTPYERYASDVLLYYQ